MAKGSITSANAKISLTIAGVFDQAQRIQGFSADNIFGTEAQEPVETQMGLDRKLSGGKVPVPVNFNITLMADSPSGIVFDNWNDQMEVANDVYTCEGLVVLPSLKTQWTLTRGFLVSYMPIPDGEKVLKARKFTIRFEKKTRQPL